MVDKHLPHDLKQMQSLPLEAKIIMTQQRIRQWYEHWDGMVYVSFSGGKDSTVLKHIVDGMYDDVPALFVNTGLEYPEIQKFAMSQKNVVTIRPKMRFDEVIKKHGYPVVSKLVSKRVKDSRSCISKGNYDAKCIQMLQGTFLNNEGGRSRYNCSKWEFLLDAPFPISHKCCDVMKKDPAHEFAKTTGRKAIVGTMATESLIRRDQWFKYGCNAFKSKNPTSAPLSFWTEQDVLHYIKKFNIPYASVYGDIVPKDSPEDQITTFDVLDDYSETELTTTGCDRTGCIFCMFGCHMEKGENRFQRLKETHPRQYEYCIGGGEYVYEAFKRDENGQWQEFDFVWKYDDGTPMTKQEIERFVQVHSVGFAGQKEEDLWIKFEKRWQPNKEGLGLGKVLDYIGVNYK